MNKDFIFLFISLPKRIHIDERERQCFHCEQVNIAFADYLAPTDAQRSNTVIVTFIILMW